MASSRRQQRHHHFSSSFSLASYLTRSERRKENISRRNTKICACYSTVDEGGSREQMMMMNFSCWCDLRTTQSAELAEVKTLFFFSFSFPPSLLLSEPRAKRRRVIGTWAQELWMIELLRANVDDFAEEDEVVERSAPCVFWMVEHDTEQELRITALRSQK